VRDGLAGLSWWVVQGGFLAATWLLWRDGGLGPERVSALTIANTFFLVAAEQLLPRVPGTNLFRDRQSLCDMLHGVTFQFAARPLAQAIAAGGAVWAAASVPGAATLWPAGWPLGVQVVLGVFLWSLLNYVFHRSLHTFEPLWWFHAVHHDTAQMHLLKSGRIHLGEEFLQFLFVPLPFLVLGVGPEVMAWVALWNVYDGNLVHSNLAQRFPDFVHPFLPTAQNHYLHHATERRLQDSNYASLPIIDVLFGTYRHPARHAVTATGLEGRPVPAGFFAQVLYPFRALANRERARAEWLAATRRS
jgi:sterol desaturase/sphingolipid hydroxylase (fatty acid hydroxylase superfamily)